MANKNSNLGAAKTAKNDEFYTQYEDIEREMNAYLEYDENVFRGKTILLPCDDPEWSNFTKYFVQNFERFGLKKLISTSYAIESKKLGQLWNPTPFEVESPNYDADKSKSHGKIFILDGDVNGNGKIDINDLHWEYLDGDGDFQSEEVKKLRDEADILATNPPFSKFDSFVRWITEANKKFIILGNMNSVSHKDVFKLLKANKLWIGDGFNLSLVFRTPYSNNLEDNKKFVKSKGYNPDDNYIKTPAIAWYTNIEHGKRHRFLPLMTMSENIKYSKHSEIRGKGYIKYCNYDAIDIPYWDAIPSDYEGVMGVPRSFMDKYCPEQFEIIGTDTKDQAEALGIQPIGEEWLSKYKAAGGTGHITAGMRNLALYDHDGTPKTPYARILIRKIK